MAICIYMESTLEQGSREAYVGRQSATARSSTRGWHGLACEWLDGALGRFLDYGCGPCNLTALVAGRCTECHGVDVDAEKIASSQKAHPDYQLSTIGFDGKMHYPNNHFDTVAIIEVIEHVPDERATLTELSRVLKPGGRLLLTTPHRGWFTFLDTGNFKFVFPRLHRFVHVYLRSDRDNYEKRFVQTQVRGLVGDITAGGDRDPWHRHYKPEELIDLCPPDLTCERLGVYFPGLRAMMLLGVVLNVCSFGLIKRLFWPLSWLERRLSYVESHTGDQLVMLFRKAETA